MIEQVMLNILTQLQASMQEIYIKSVVCIYNYKLIFICLTFLLVALTIN